MGLLLTDRSRLDNISNTLFKFIYIIRELSAVIKDLKSLIVWVIG